VIWLAWRQFRAAAVTTAAALVALALTFAISRPRLADELSGTLSSCRAAEAGPRPPGSPTPSGVCSGALQEFFDGHRPAFLLVTALVLAVPALVGLFWGAPLVAREIEAGTHRLVWNQGVTRRRWLAVKLGLVGLGALVAAGLASLAAGWWAGPIDTAAAHDLPRVAPLVFAARGVAPIAYAAFAFTLGVATGMLVRRSVPAMAITLVVFVAVQLAVPALLRPHLLPPVVSTIELGTDNPEGFQVQRQGPRGVSVEAGDSGAWLLSTRMVDGDGRTVEAADLAVTPGPCGSSGPQAPDRCLAEMNRRGYRIEVTYQPASRFWPLQWAEAGLYAALALGLTAVCLRRARNDVP
jgi:hypothetical protein